MTTKEKVVIVLWAILALSLTGCNANVQIGKTNTWNQSQQHKEDNTYRHRLRTGQVSIQESMERAKND